MSTLLASLSPGGVSVSAPTVTLHDVSTWQSRLVPSHGVLLENGKVTAQSKLKALSLDELAMVHRLADAINTESAWRIERALVECEITAEILEPLLPALNLELSVTGQKKKFGVIENGAFKARTFSGGVVFQHSFAR